MIIVSKFRDYYDCIQSSGVDKSITYQREERELKPTLYGKFIEFAGVRRFSIQIEDRDRWGKSSHLYPFFVMFCGKLYIGFQKYIRYQSSYKEEESFITYNYEWVRQQVKSRASGRFHYRNLEKDFESVLSMRGKDCDMADLAAPTVVIKHDKTFIDGCLADVKFQKIKDPYTAYQEIMQYISGVLGVNAVKEPWSISDELKADSKGYDKWSFRRRSHPRKGKR